MTHVDYMSLDVESYELPTLVGIDFDKIDISCISVENNKTRKDLIRRYLIDKGYIWLAKLAFDDIYLKKSLWN